MEISQNVKIRGRLVDILATKGDELVAVEIKVNRAGLQRGIEYALHEKTAANFSYPALPNELITGQVRETCRNLGLGPLSADGKVTEVVKPVRGRSMPSALGAVTGSHKQKRKSINIISSGSSLDKLFKSRTLVSILKLLLLHVNEEFHLNELPEEPIWHHLLSRKRLTFC